MSTIPTLQSTMNTPQPLHGYGTLANPRTQSPVTACSAACHSAVSYRPERYARH